jgi:hypothetical protein
MVLSASRLWSLPRAPALELRRRSASSPTQNLYSAALASKPSLRVAIESRITAVMVRAHRPHSALQPRRL